MATDNSPSKQSAKKTALQWIREGWTFPANPKPGGVPTNANLAFLHEMQSDLTYGTKHVMDLGMLALLAVRTPDMMWRSTVLRARDLAITPRR